MSKTDRIGRFAFVYSIGALGGALAAFMGSPLPWMIGPLLVTAVLYLTGLADIVIPVKTRPVGQIIIASQVGVYFSPAAFAMVLTLAPLLVGMALATAVCAFVVALLLARAARLNLTAAFLASLPTSPVEAAIMAERFQCNPGPVILSQTVRIAAVVVLVPIIIYAIDGWPDAAAVRMSAAFDYQGTALLLAVGIAGALLFFALRVPNPYFLGPLAASSVLAAFGFGPYFYPAVILSGGQVVLGVWLGSTFRRSLFKTAGRLVITSILSTLLLLAMTCAVAVVIAAALGLEWELMVLSAAPGGVTEMALTAKFLGQDVALITAFHLTRIFIFVPNIHWIIGLIHRYEKRYPRAAGPNE
ncbi:AbrB family transcriptional regulator [Agrobacterium sp. LAD9]|uniref:AbrB family transcriptional regulator n=1 Tax=Agrobacterium sp. LAD9 TaxID=2055153 RepID=UPI000D1E4D7F|nr:AbrB family transcriptional regulator [Agrobacterium sp. LAD9]